MSASLHFLTRVLFVSIMALKSIHNDLGNCSFCVSSYLFLNETFNSQLIQGSHFRRKKACIIFLYPASSQIVNSVTEGMFFVVITFGSLKFSHTSTR